MAAHFQPYIQLSSLFPTLVSNVPFATMVSTVNLQRLVECREHEETRLHILISQRRKRKLDDMIAEESSTANSSVTQKHPQHPPDKVLLQGFGSWKVHSILPCFIVIPVWYLEQGNTTACVLHWAVCIRESICLVSAKCSYSNCHAFIDLLFVYTSLTLNSIINLTFDYTKIANVSKQKVNAYKEKNAFADPQLRQVSRRIMKHITKHATSEVNCYFTVL